MPGIATRLMAFIVFFLSTPVPVSILLSYPYSLFQCPNRIVRVVCLQLPFYCYCADITLLILGLVQALRGFFLLFFSYLVLLSAFLFMCQLFFLIYVSHV